MKKIILFIFCIIGISAMGQTRLELYINNVAPRVGQKVIISITPDFFAGYLQQQVGEAVKVSSSASSKQLFFNEFKRTLTFEEAKEYQIGPFEFEFNGIKYITNSIIVNVKPELPQENGLWLELIEKDGELYLELTQRIGSSEQLMNLNYSFMTAPVSKPQELAKLKSNLTDGIELTNISTVSNTANGITNCITKYKVKFTSGYNGSYVISEKDFENLPRSYKIGEIAIEK